MEGLSEFLVLSSDTVGQEKPAEKGEIGTTGPSLAREEKLSWKTALKRKRVLEQMRQDRFEFQKRRLEQEERKIALLERKVLQSQEYQEKKIALLEKQVLLLEKQTSQENGC